MVGVCGALEGDTGSMPASSSQCSGLHGHQHSGSLLKNKSPERIAFLLCRVFKSDIRKQILLHLWILFLGEVLTTKKIRSSSIALGSAGIHQEVRGCLTEAACLRDSYPPQAAEGRSSDLLK